MQRALASIQKVLSLGEIPDADFIAKATVQGWTTVVKKGDFKVGDAGIFYEIDSIPMDLNIYKFLWTTSKNPEGIRPNNYRIKTMKLRKQLSQGLLLPVQQVFDAHDIGGIFLNGKNPIGYDLTTLLGVEKWEPPVDFSGVMDGPWSFSYTGASKTDEMRLQSAMGVLEELQGLPYYISLKIDGTSCSTGYDVDDVFRVNSRNNSVAPADNAYWYVAREYNLEVLLKDTGYIIQGELAGPGIQKNLCGLRKPELFVFDVYDTIQKRYLVLDELRSVCADYHLRMVDVLEEGDNFNYTLDELLEKAVGYYPGTKNKSEGIVIKPSRFIIYSPTLGGRLSFKVLNNLYLLAEKD